MDAKHDLIVIGAGMAAGELIAALRRDGFSGRMAMVGEEEHFPYQRPPLSKGYLAGTASLESLNYKPPTTYDGWVEFISKVRATQIERSSRRVHLSDGRRLAYGKLVLAIGGRARMLDEWKGSHACAPANLHSIRTVDDVERLRPKFLPGARLVIIGGGYIGLEVAAVAVKRGLKVILLEALPRVLARVTAPLVSEFYENEHRRAGVDMRTGVTVRNFEIDSSGETIQAVRCSDGTVLEVDVVIHAIGMIPNTDIAEAAGLAVENGVLVDEDMRTSDGNILAIGDCARYPDVLTRQRIRLESVANATEQARCAAASILGKSRVARGVPWFWSDQYDLKLQIAGLFDGYDDIAVRGSTKDRSFAAIYLKQGRVISFHAVNRQREFGAMRDLAARRPIIDLARAADISYPLDNLP